MQEKLSSESTKTGSKAIKFENQRGCGPSISKARIR